VLAIGPEIRGLTLGRGQWIFKDGKIRSITPFAGKLMALIPFRTILQHVKERYEYERDTSEAKFIGHFFANFLLLRE
jgi:lipid A disaccharide synthetase